MSNHYRPYLDDEPVRIGDVIRFDDQSFGTAIIVAEKSTAYGKEFTLQRPHIMFKGGAPTPMVETFVVTEKSLRTNMMVFVTGPSSKVENRNY